MARAVGAFAARLAASFVTLDERTPQDRLERRQATQESGAALSQGGSGLFYYIHRTTYTTGLIVN
jgi:hypothetical protein